LVWILPALHHINPWLLCLLVGIILLLESCGIPILNSSLLLFAGAVASLGHVNIIALAFTAITGSVVGACLAYFIGLHGGEPALRHFIILLHLDTKKIEQARRWFSRAGGRMIFLSRIVPYIRPFSCFFGGISRMPFRRFFVAACSGSIIWCVGMLTAGWILGRRWLIALSLMRAYTLPTLGVIALLVVIYILARITINRRRHSLGQVVCPPTASAESQQSGDLIEV